MLRSRSADARSEEMEVQVPVAPPSPPASKADPPGPEVFRMASDESQDEAEAESDGDFFPDFSARKEGREAAKEESSWKNPSEDGMDGSGPQMERSGAEEPRPKSFDGETSTFSPKASDEKQADPEKHPSTPPSSNHDQTLDPDKAGWVVGCCRDFDWYSGDLTTNVK